MADFVHLHNHSDFSLLDGAASVPSMVAKAKALGMPGLALTDHGNMYGAVKFYDECKGLGINPIVGSEFYVAGGARTEKTGTENGNKYYHLILLAQDATGYKNLLKLSSASFTEGYYYKPRIDDEILAANCEGLICSSACIAGEIPSLVLMGKAAEAERKAREVRRSLRQGPLLPRAPGPRHSRPEGGEQGPRRHRAEAPAAPHRDERHALS